MLAKSGIQSIPSDTINYQNTAPSSQHFNLFVQSHQAEASQAKKPDADTTIVKWKFIYSVIQLLVAIAFLLAGITPWISEIPVYLFSFQSGIPVPFLYAVSVIAMLLALIQLMPVTSFAAQLGLTLISIAASAVHLIVGSPLHLVMPALLLALLMLLTISLNYKLASPGTSSYPAFE